MREVSHPHVGLIQSVLLASPRILGGSVYDQVAEVIEAIRPAIQADGGDIILHTVDEPTGIVEVELTGACVSCPASTVTMKAGIERIMKDRVPGVTLLRERGSELIEDGTAVSL